MTKPRLKVRSPSPALRRLRAAQKRARERRGVALVMVLGAITVLTVFLVELQEDTSASLSASLSERDTLRAEYAARSSVNLGRLLIASEPAVRDKIGVIFKAMGQTPPQIPVWAFADKLLGPFNGEAAGQAFAELAGIDREATKNGGLGDVSFEIRVVDEDSKLNLNSPAEGTPLAQYRYGAGFLSLSQPTQYDALFEAPDGDGQFSDRIAICSAIADWTDFDENQYACSLADNATGEGSEDAIYDSLGLGYRRKNAPFDSLEELRLVRGISDDFWATFVEPDPTDPDSRVMSVWGQGKVNVNTANAMTLLAIVCANAPESAICTDPTQLETFVMVVTLLRGAVQGVPLFRTPKGFTSALEGKGQLGPILTSLGLEPVVWKSKAEVRKQISTDSKVFSIYADGIVKGYKRETRVRVHSVIDFRSAAELGADMAGAQAGTPPSGSSSTTGEDEESDGPPSDEELALAAASDPAGIMLYYRIE